MTASQLDIPLKETLLAAFAPAVLLGDMVDDATEPVPVGPFVVVVLEVPLELVPTSDPTCVPFTSGSN